MGVPIPAPEATPVSVSGGRSTGAAALTVGLLARLHFAYEPLAVLGCFDVLHSFEAFVVLPLHSF